ncbi:MAG: acyl-CoA dehydratase activase [Planctomycetota bacterium]|jgi:predicted CoA-substrate-specific enzyme activase
MTAALYVGVDAGSSATKCVVLDGAGGPIGWHVQASGFNYAEAAEAVLTHALAQADALDHPISNCVSTGYGRNNVPFADEQITEITCHARGAREWYPQVRSIVDIGGQDTKIIRLNAHGGMADYRMNAKCAAGTGTFLESVALRLGMPLAEIDTLAMQSTATTVVNSYCTVFAGTEVLERIKAGQPREDISMGLFRSIASRVFEMIAAHDGPVAATGGVVAHCRAMVRALEEILDTEVLLPPLPQHAGAYGAALLAREWDQSQSRCARPQRPQSIQP